MGRTVDVIIRNDNLVMVSKELLNNKPKLTKNYTNLLLDSVDIIKKHRLIKFDNDTPFILGPIDGYWSGLFHDNSGVLELDFIKAHGRVSFLQILCHELIHAEQKFLGKSYWYRGVPYWNGKKYKWMDDSNGEMRPDSLELYNDYPWEKEAYRREGELACEVMGLLKQAKY